VYWLMIIFKGMFKSKCVCFVGCKRQNQFLWRHCQGCKDMAGTITSSKPKNLKYHAFRPLFLPHHVFRAWLFRGKRSQSATKGNKIYIRLMQPIGTTLKKIIRVTLIKSWVNEHYRRNCWCSFYWVLWMGTINIFFSLAIQQKMTVSV
jgi:hypothetical protein